ncbi:hypothetical protein [Anaerosolibacter sp.]|uniref:hypothetical protein n=1 Tax=Anaerosolibacter sp. TaxID=1872527 RepID=UPI0039EE6D77
MSTKIDNKTKVPQIIEALDQLSKKKILIGVFGEDDSFILMIARVHEFGMTITPKNKRYLTIPLNKLAKEKSPKDFNDLFSFKADSGELYLVREKGKDKLEFMYWLAKSVTIPERSYMRGAYDHKLGDMERRVKKLLNQVITLQITTDTFFKVLGEYIVGIVQKYMTDLKEPAKSPITLAQAPDKSNPLIQDGRLRQAITYKVVG